MFTTFYLYLAPLSIQQPGISYPWLLAIGAILVLTLLYFIRKYERNLQISRRRKAESDFRRTRKDYLEILDQLQDSYVETDSNGVITHVNIPFVNELGFENREDLTGKHLSGFTQEKLARGVTNSLESLVRTGEPLEHLKTRYTGKEGKSFIGEGAFTPILEEGKVTGIKGTIRNITKRSETERNLAYQKDFHDALLQQAPIAITIVDKNRNISLVNPAFLKLFMRAENELIGKGLSNFLTSSEIVSAMSRYVENRPEDSLFLTGQTELPDGKQTELEVFMQPFFAGSINYGHLVFFNDISERRKAEKELISTTTAHRAVLETLQDPYFEADEKGFFTYVNQKLVEATRFQSKKELIGRHFRHLVAFDSRISFLKHFRQSFITKKRLKPLQFNYLTKNGEVFTSEVVASPIVEEERVVGTRGIIRDISIRVKAEEILKAAKEAAERRAGELASINSVAEKVSSSLNLTEILNKVGEELIRIFPVRTASISILDPVHQLLEVLNRHSVNGQENSGTSLKLELKNNSETWQVIHAKNPFITGDHQRDQKTRPILEHYGYSGSLPCLIVPLITRGQTVGLIGMELEDSQTNYENLIELAETIASQIASAIDNARLHSQTEKARDLAERDLEIGSEIQRGFFPQEIPEIPGWEIATYFKAARQVSGDFYDVFPIGNTPYMGMVIADVCDKGVGAALFMVLLRSLIRSSSERFTIQAEADDILAQMTNSVNNYIVNTHGQSNMFATLVLIILDPVTNRIHYVNGGHDSPLLIKNPGKIVQELEPTGPAFGFSTEIPFEFHTIDIQPGDLLVSFTDGFSEARNSSGNFYTDERIRAEATRKWPSAFSVVKHFEAEVYSHLGEQTPTDDLTLLALRRESQKEPVRHSFIRKAEKSNLSLFRDFAKEVCQQYNVQEAVTDAVKLAVDEVCSNLIIHGYKGMEPGDIHLSIFRENSGLIISLTDTGHPFDPETLDPPLLSEDIEERKIGGLGVYLVKELMDDVSYEIRNGTNCLTLKKKYELTEN